MTFLYGDPANEMVIPTRTVEPLILPSATQITAGLMSAADKTKLDGLVPGGGGVVVYVDISLQPGLPTDAITVNFAPAMPSVAYFVDYATADLGAFVMLDTHVNTPSQFVIQLSGKLSTGIIKCTITAV